MKAFDSWKALFIVIGLFAIVISLNVIVRRFAPVRWDTTEGDIFTLSEGTRSILKKAKESGRPITIRFYLSDQDDVQLPKHFIEYSKRVKDLLEEYAKASGNSVVVQTYTPVPNSKEQDAADLDGIMRRDPRMDMPQGGSLDDFDFNQRANQPYYFGLSVSSLEKTEVIAFLDPKQEENLEYHLSRAISAVTRTIRRKIGLLEGTEMALGGQGGMPGQGRPPSVIYRHLAREFDIVSIPFDVGPMRPDHENHPFAGLDLLLIVHPVKVNRPQPMQPGFPAMGATTLEFLSTETQYAIDQYLVNGGKAIAFLDNQHFVSRFFDVYSTVLPLELQENHPKWYKDLYNLFESSGWSHYRSGLDELTTAWGVNLGDPKDGNPLIYDPEYTHPVSYNRPLQQMVSREFRLGRMLEQIPGQNRQLIIRSIARGHGLMTRFENDALTKDHPVTRGLASILMVDPSPIMGKPKKGLRMRTLVRTSGKAKSIPGDLANLLLNQAENLQQVTTNFQSASAKPRHYPVAVLLEGKFKSAYDDDPTKEPEPEIAPPAPIAPEPVIPPLQPPLLPPDAPDSVDPPEPAPEPTPEPAPEPTPEPAPEPTPEPAPE
ncbi:MAG: Gldg family protein, partial [Roseibacillus sp.]